MSEPTTRAELAMRLDDIAAKRVADHELRTGRRVSIEHFIEGQAAASLRLAEAEVLGLRECLKVTRDLIRFSNGQGVNVGALKKIDAALSAPSSVARELVDRMEKMEAALKEMDDRIWEYGIDTVGTGSMPLKKEQARVDAILDRSRERRALRMRDKR